MAKNIFWISVAAIIFAYVGYSLSILLMALVRGRRVRSSDDYTPSVSIIITAYNEERGLAEKLAQTLALEYPPHMREIIVGSDGSTDRTDEIAMSFADRGVRLLRVEGRVGKTETQNQAVGTASGEILVFSDATTRYDSRAIRMLVRNFADPEVGAVSGRYEYFNPTGAAIGLGSILFWRYENLIKRLQTRIGTITGCCGCIYSVRRSAFVPLPPDIISDLCEPLKVLESGYRIVFEPDAIAFEETTEQAREEFAMRVRVAVRGMRGLIFMRTLLNPLKFGFVSYQLLGHKISRWFVVLFLASLLLANLWLLDSRFYQVTLALQVALYLAALVGWLAERFRLRVPLVNIPLFFVTVNFAAAVAMWRVIKGVRAVTWETLRR